jgi:hypothetical protein
LWQPATAHSSREIRLLADSSVVGFLDPRATEQSWSR